MTNVLFDVPGPRARRRQRVGAIAGGVVVAALVGLFVWRLASQGQFEYELWEPLVTPNLMLLLLEGLLTTLRVAAVAVVLSVLFGALFGLARLSERSWLRWVAGTIVEFFRAVPVLMLIFAFGIVYGSSIGLFWCLVLGLTLYNGSVLAEVFRAGVLAVPRGQGEAAYAIGMRKAQVTTQVLLPQAVRIMLPAIVSQCVVVLKDSALGFVLPLDELAYAARAIRITYENPIQTYVVVAAMYILINWALSRLATWLEGRQRRGGRESVKTAEAALLQS
jgi:glutamate transport system permease protein